MRREQEKGSRTDEDAGNWVRDVQGKGKGERRPDGCKEEREAEGGRRDIETIVTIIRVAVLYMACVTATGISPMLTRTGQLLSRSFLTA